MSDYTVRHIDEVPNYSLPPVHFDGIRYSGDSSVNSWGVANGEWYNEFLPVLRLGACDGGSAEDIDYGSETWSSECDQISGRAYACGYLTGMGYQFFLGNYGDEFPAFDSSRWFTIEDAKLGFVDEEPDYYPEYNDDSYGVCFVADNLNTITPNYTPTGDSLGVSISDVYAFGWGDAGSGELRFSPHLKHGNFIHNSRKAGYNSLPAKQQLGQIYQFGFLVGNECDEIDIEFEIINEHPLIKWDFFLGACVNRKDIVGFDLETRDEDLFVYDPKSGLATGYYGEPSGECSSTKYNVSLRNINTQESVGLVQVALINMDFNSRGEDYLPYSLWDKITATGTEGMDSQWNQEFSGYFWKGRYDGPEAHHLRPWYEKAKDQSWDSATGFFNVIDGAALSGQVDSSFNSVFFDHGGIARNTTLQRSPSVGNYSDDQPTWLTYAYQTVNITGQDFCEETITNHKAYFINYGGFGKIIKEDLFESPYTWDRVAEFAPVSITVNSITAKKRVKKYYATFPILGLASGKYLTIEDASDIDIGDQVHHICDFDFGHLGLLNGIYEPHYVHVYDKTSNKIAIKETKTCDEVICGWEFDSDDVDSGVVRILTNSRTGYYCRFEEDSEFCFSPHEFVSGDLISFEYSSLPTGNFSVCQKEDYVVSYVEETFLGGDDVYKFKLRTPRYNNEGQKPNKFFNQELICSGYVGDITSNIREMSPNNILAANVDLVSVVNCSGVLPVLPTRYVKPQGSFDSAPTYTLGAC